MTCGKSGAATGQGAGTDLARDIRIYREMLRIRRAEECILAMSAEGVLRGTTHVCIGQEANAVGVIGALDPERDFVVSNHRCHGHYLAHGGDLRELLAEVRGASGGVCAGRGGSQHLKRHNFLSNGIQGGGTPIACGLAMANALSGAGGIVACCIGDGTLGQGVLYESLNMAALWSLPVLFLVEANGYAQSTPTRAGVSGSIVGRARSFGIETMELESTDVLEIRRFGEEASGRVRDARKPLWAVVHTCRLCAHSKGDDTRSEEEVAALRENDPLLVHGSRLSEAEMVSAEDAVREEVERARTGCATEDPA